MSVEELKELLGTQETILELVQLDDGALALRVSNSEDVPLVRIEFNEEVRKILGENTGMVAQHMIQAAIYGVMENQANKWHANVLDQKPQFYS
ncbi:MULTISPECIES: hypothetical protein [Acinetobacter]|jgi:hypothetical protein|uniref:Uncharacterized protein n=2 Tax=Acinetobacter TaxID=469 RepID=A0A1Z9Z2G0_9GAMM|nr:MULTISPECIES: hypothetical protein [Acinetobacter]MCH4246956.1 hypothetical protein [Acinetobacter populi]OUY08612.1 hypothetical protein CAP51_03090 [Acinetobacter populi]SNX43347.1 hypothetical protein SAMN05421731_101383 [Acinetobacter puyangensis]